MARIKFSVICVLAGFWGTAFAQTIAPVSVVPVKVQSISKAVEGHGTLTPDLGKDATISTVTPLRIEAILVRPGDTVRKGQLLVKLQWDQTLDMDVEKADIALKQARLNLVRYNTLYKNGVAPKVQLEEARTAFNLAKADSGLQARSLAYAVSNSEIRAPIGGVVGAVDGVVGQIADPSMRILRIVNTKTMVARVGVELEDVGRVREGQEADVTVPNLSGHNAFRGTVARLNREVDPASQLVIAWIDLANPSGMLQPGMFAEAHIFVKTDPRALVVPRSAVLKDAAGPYVFVVSGGAAHRVSVKTGIETDTEVEILSGLKKGQQVVYEGNYELEDGMPVAIQHGA